MEFKKDAKYDIACYGNGLIDLITHVSIEDLKVLGLEKGSYTPTDAEFINKIMESLKNNSWQKMLGGSALNTLRVSAKLGLKNYFVCKIGEDDYGKFLTKVLDEHKITQDCAISPSLSTGILISLVTPDTERTMISNLGAARDLNIKDIKSMEPVENTKIYHTTAYKLMDEPTEKLTLEAIRIAKDSGVKISFDPADVGVIKHINEKINIVIKESDIVFLNEEEATALAGGIEEAFKKLSAHTELIIIKTGKEGCIIYEKSTDKKIVVKGFVVDAIDTTGAGDSFAGGFLYGLIKGLPLETCGKIGNYIASKIVQNLGVGLTDENLNEIKEFIG